MLSGISFLPVRCVADENGQMGFSVSLRKQGNWRTCTFFMNLFYDTDSPFSVTLSETLYVSPLAR